ncbi:MAG: DUF58 domain-containing protein [Alphaproteobacteria bacterium]|nr:DUF58 domain-containing protein [Alphaproteobacteria bacterium]
MIAPTGRAILLAAAGAPISLVLAATAPGAWPLGPAWALGVLALTLADSQLGRPNDRLRIETKLPRFAGIGAGQITAWLRLVFTQATPRTAEIALGTNQFFTASPARLSAEVVEGEAITAFKLAPQRRGDGRVEHAYVRWQGPLGLAWCQRVEPLDQKVAITPDLEAVERNATRLFSRTFVYGLKPMKDRGDGSEFDALAKFETGMDRRMVDWKQSARHLNLLAKEVRAERNHQIAFAIDTGRLMCEPVAGAPRVDRALNAALMLAYVGLKLGDRVSFFGFDAKPHLATGFVAGPRAFTLLKALTAELDYSTEETNHTLGLATLAERLQRRSMVVVFTDFADTVSAELMIENVARLARRHMIVFVAFHDEELETLRSTMPETSDDVSRAVIAHRLLRERSLVLARLRRLGVYIVDAPSQNLGAELVRAYDELRRRERI